MHIEWNEANNGIVNDKVLAELKKYKDVIVFGAGESGEWTVKLLRENNIFPKCYCDNSPRKWGELKNDLCIKPFEDAVKEYGGGAICVASMWKEQIYKQICEYDALFADRTYDLLTTMAWETSDKLYKSNEYDYIKYNLDAFENLYNELADKISKTTLEGLLNYRLTRNSAWLKKIKSNERPYVDATVLKESGFENIWNSTIIDGGAFDGDTIELLIQSNKEKNVLNIHCYEAEDGNCRIIEEKENNGRWCPHQVILHKAALWNEKTEIGFDGNGLSGNVDRNNDRKVKAERIDDYPYGKVGLIKLDIEGAERRALAGAVKVIKKNRPVLAICAYHLQDDLLVLSDFIKSLECGYRLYLRHYMLSSGDSILYGIPYF